MVYSNIEFNNSGAFDPDSVYQGILENERLNAPVLDESYDALYGSIVGALDRFSVERYQSTGLNVRQMKYEGVKGWKADLSIQLIVNVEEQREWDAKVLIFNNQGGSRQASLAINESPTNELFFVTPDLSHMTYTLSRLGGHEPIINCSGGFGMQELSRAECEDTEAVALAEFIDEVFVLNKTQHDT